MDTKKLFETVDSLRDEYVDILASSVRIESPTEYKAGVDAVCDYFMQIAKKHGWKTEVLKLDVSGNAGMIVMNPDAPGKPVCISGHMDTVHPIGAFGKDPVTIDGDIIRGPGVCDCKGGITVGLMAMDALSRCGFTARPVKLILQSDEEVGSVTSDKATVRYMCEQCRGAEAFLNLEPCDSGDSIHISMERKGIIRYDMTVTGKAGHSAGCANPAYASAIAEATYKIQEFEKFKDSNGITCNIGMISGGTAPNTVPDKCVFTIDFRFRTPEQLEIIEREVKRITEQTVIPGCASSCEEQSRRDALPYTERNKALFDRANDILEKAGLERLIYQKNNGGTDAAYVSATGVPTMDSLGIVSGFCHSLKEYAKISGLVLAAKRVAVIISEL